MLISQPTLFLLIIIVIKSLLEQCLSIKTPCIEIEFLHKFFSKIPFSEFIKQNSKIDTHLLKITIVFAHGAMRHSFIDDILHVTSLYLYTN